MRFKSFNEYTKKTFKIKKALIYTFTERGSGIVQKYYQDMIRYDACFVNKKDLFEVEASVLAEPQRRFEMFKVRVLYVHTTDWKPQPEIGRWHSFGISIGDPQEVQIENIDLSEWVHYKHSKDYGSYDSVRLADMVVPE